MMMFGLSNCDTVRKARVWLTERGVSFVFHDFRKDGLNPNLIASWLGEIGWERLLNRSGTTFRGLPLESRENIDEEKAVALMCAYPALVRRPVLETRTGPIVVGFDPAKYAEILNR